MRSPVGRGLFVCVLALATALPAPPAAAQSATIKVAFWNVRSGKGAPALAGHASPFVDTTNCTDLTQPLNAWGVGAVQAELAKLNGVQTASAQDGKFREGPFALQYGLGAKDIRGGAIKWRKVQVREL